MKSYLRQAGKYVTDPVGAYRNVAWRLPKTYSDRPYVFVVGAPRSGTTLLQRILTLHSRFYSIDRETGLFSKRNIFAKDSYFGLSSGVTRELFKTSVDVVDFFDKAIARIEKEEGCEVFVEKTPQHVFRMGFILRHFRNARIISLVRDGRDCFRSSKGHPSIPQRRNAKTFSRYWCKCVRVAQPYISNDRVYSLKYESLVTDPDGQMRRVMNFLGQELEANQLHSQSIGQDARSQRKEFSRLAQPIDPSSVGRWREELTASEIRDFESIAGPDLARLGYTV